MNTNKLASMILKMFQSDVEWAYKYSLGLLEADMSYASIVTIFKDKLPSDYFTEKKTEAVSTQVSKTKLEEVFVVDHAAINGNTVVRSEHWGQFQPPQGDHEDPAMNVPDPYDHW